MPTAQKAETAPPMHTACESEGTDLNAHTHAHTSLGAAYIGVNLFWASPNAWFQYILHVAFFGEGVE